MPYVQSRGFAFLSFLSREEAVEAINLINNNKVVIAGSTISAELSKPKAKGSAKKKGSEMESLTDKGFRKARGPSKPRHPESHTCSAVRTMKSQRRGSEKSVVYTGVVKK